MTDAITETEQVALAVQALRAMRKFRAGGVDQPREEANALIDALENAERQMLPLMQANGETTFRFGEAHEDDAALFVLRTTESTDSGRSGSVDDWGTRKIKPRVEFHYIEEA